MRPGYVALFFWVLAACAAFGIVNSLRTGIAHGENRSYHIDAEPIGFMMVILVNVFFIGFAIAETLYALGLSGDPMAALRSHMPFGAYLTFND
jgi:TRAP-type mannitol/chloroaromatic compound transport system permease large subunit